MTVDTIEVQPTQRMTAAPAAAVSASLPLPISPAHAFTGRLEGRGIYIGAVGENGLAMHFNELSWEATCRQAYDWGMRYIHPKVAEGERWWYTPDEMKMLRDTALKNGVICAPYIWCWGNYYSQSPHNFSLLDAEATLVARIGAIFGIILPDIEAPYWNNHADWAIQFGRVLDAEIDRLGVPVEVYPDLMGNPSVQSIPYEDILAWKHVRGWRPMVYFSVWTGPTGQDTAQQAIDYVYPMWKALDARLAARHIPARPIYPIIEVQGLPQAEVHAWAEKAQHYGYIGYWYIKPYPAYADTVLHAPVPNWVPVVVAPVPPSPSPVKPTPPAPAAPIVPPPTTETEWGTLTGSVPAKGIFLDTDGQLRQSLTPTQLRILFHLVQPNLAWNTEAKLLDWWAALTGMFPEMFLGVPTGPEEVRIVEGEDTIKILRLTSGRSLVWFNKESTAALV